MEKGKKEETVDTITDIATSLEQKCGLSGQLNSRAGTSTDSEDPLSETLTESQMMLSDNPQTWLFCTETTNEEEIWDLSGWLNYAHKYDPENSNRLYDLLTNMEVQEKGGGFDSRTFVRQRKPRSNMIEGKTMYGRNIYPYLPKNIADTKGATCQGFHETHMPNKNLTQNQFGGIGIIGESSTIHLSKTSKMRRDDSLSINKMKQSKGTLGHGQELLQNVSVPSDFFSDVDISSFENKSNRMTVCGIDENPCDSIQGSQFPSQKSNIEIKSPEENEKLFMPRSMSTPSRQIIYGSRTISKKQTSYDETQLYNATFVKNKNSTPLSRTWDVVNNSALSRSDPAILESTKSQEINRTFTKDEKRYQSKNLGSHNRKSNSAYIGSDSNLNKGHTLHNETITLDNDDTGSCTSDSSFSYSSSSHIRSLGDVRSAARLQEESLRILPSREARGKFSRLGSIRPQEYFGKMKKGLSEEGIGSSESSELSNLVSSKINKVQGSLSNLNNNNTRIPGLRPPSKSGIASSTLYCNQRLDERPLNISSSRSVGEQIAPKPTNGTEEKPQTSKIPLSKKSALPVRQSKIPTRNLRGSTQSSSRGNWRDGCY